MNFLPARIEAGRVLGAAGPIAAPLPPGLAEGARVTAAMRPERLHVDAAGRENSLSGTIAAMAYHGLDLQLHIATPAAPAPVVMRLTASEAETRALAPGDTVTAHWAAADTRIFPE